MTTLERQVVATGYEENAESIHKPVLRITNHKKLRNEDANEHVLIKDLIPPFKYTYT